MFYSPLKSLQFEEIKNEGLEVIRTPPNPSLPPPPPPPLKNIQKNNLTYSPSFYYTPLYPNKL